MLWQLCSILFIGALLEWKLTHCAPAEVGKIKEKVRAYEFGFSIEEQQHRHEKRDENGIVMGEFGFITADGIYHVTVYATDENGKFKIISMKNYPYGKQEKKTMIAMLPPAKKPVVTPTVVKVMTPDQKSCGGCVLPKKFNLLPADVKGKKPDNEKEVFRPLSQSLNDISVGKSNGEISKTGKGISTVSGLSPGEVSTGNGIAVSQQSSPKPPGSQSLIPPKIPSTSGSQIPNSIGSSLSKTGTRISSNGGKEYQITNSETHTTQTRPYIQMSNGRGTRVIENSQETKTGIGLSSPKQQSNLPLRNNLFELPKYNTNTTQQKLRNSLRKLTPTLPQTQFLENLKRKSILNNLPEFNTQLGSSYQNNQFIPVLKVNGRDSSLEESLQNTKPPNSFTNPSFPLNPTVRLNPTNSLITFKNPNKLFQPSAHTTVASKPSTNLPTRFNFARPLTRNKSIDFSDQPEINSRLGLPSQEKLSVEAEPTIGRNALDSQILKFTSSSATPLSTFPSVLNSSPFGSPYNSKNTTPQQFRNSIVKSTPSYFLEDERRKSIATKSFTKPFENSANSKETQFGFSSQENRKVAAAQTNERNPLDLRISKQLSASLTNNTNPNKAYGYPYNENPARHQLRNSALRKTASTPSLTQFSENHESNTLTLKKGPGTNYRTKNNNQFISQENGRNSLSASAERLKITKLPSSLIKSTVLSKPSVLPHYIRKPESSDSLIFLNNPSNPTYNTNNVTPLSRISQAKTSTIAQHIPQIPGYHEKKNNPTVVNSRFDFPSQLTLQKYGKNPSTAYGSLDTINTLSPSLLSNTYNTKTKKTNLLISLNNQNNIFSAYNTKTLPPEQRIQSNSIPQNTARPTEQKSFQSLSKILPDQKTGVTTPSTQTQNLNTNSPLTRNTIQQQSGRGPVFVTSPAETTATPKLTNTNILTQSQQTGNSLTSKRLQQNTNETKTTTPNIPSTKKLTLTAPSLKSTGKPTSSANAGGIGSGGVASPASSGGGGGDGPLYRFKYVLDYNSHHEEGRIDGSKEGNYNTIGEDGIRRIIDYIANENGYQPHIKLERPPPNDLPTGENKLKEYEFVWFN